MTAESSAQDAHAAQRGGDQAEQAQSGTLNLVTSWGAAYGERFRAAIRLVMAEARLAVTSFILMLVAVILAVFAIMFAWGLLLFAGVEALALVGAPLVFTAIGLALAHIVVAALLWRAASKLGSHLDFEATRQMLEKES